MARPASSLGLLGLALSLAAVYWGGFTSRASAGPDWWAPAIVLAAVLGVGLTAATTRVAVDVHSFANVTVHKIFFVGS